MVLSWAFVDVFKGDEREVRAKFEYIVNLYE